MILSVSRRTDIPAFYSDWFYNRIKEGKVYVRNPMNPHKISSIALSPDNIDCIVFWTKNPSDSFISNLIILDDLKIPYYFQFTIVLLCKVLHIFVAKPLFPRIKLKYSKFFYRFIDNKKCSAFFSYAIQFM